MTLEEIEFRIQILDAILQEARANGDDRWHEPARQIDELNQKRADILKARNGDIPPITVFVKAGRMGAKTKHG